MVNPGAEVGLDASNRWPITRAGWETLMGYRLPRETSQRLWGHPPPDVARRCGWQPTPIEAAMGQSTAAWAREAAPPPLTTVPTTAVVLGDPQAPLKRLFQHLDHQGLLTADGWLRADIGLICVGDYFDFAADDPETAGYDGVRFLAWLAAHDPAQVTLLLGNHDVERVMSLADATRADYLTAQAACREMLSCPTTVERRAYLETWVGANPELPPPVAAHDYRSFVPAQSGLVRRLLVAGRLRLAATAWDGPDRVVLITHAGVTWREHALLGNPPDAASWAAGLNACLDAAVARVRNRWNDGRADRLDLAPLYHGWEHMRPNGGCLIHRPDARQAVLTHDQRLGLEPPAAPRSVAPEQFLIPGLHQVVGHTVAAQRMVPWLQPAVTSAAQAANPGSILGLGAIEGRYRLGLRQEIWPSSTSVLFADVALAATNPVCVDLLLVTRVDGDIVAT